MEDKIIKFVLDIGSLKIKLLAGLLTDSGQKLEVLKYIEVDTNGLKKGKIEEEEKIVESLISAVQLMEEELKLKMSRVSIGIGGVNIISKTKNIKIVLEEEREIKEEDIEDLFKVAKNELKNEEEEVIAEEYYNLKINKSGIVKNPIGLQGKELQGDIHLVLIKKEDIDKVREIISRAGLEIEGIYLSSYAAAKSTLSDEEKQMGVASIDIGEETTDIIIYKNNKMIYTKSLSLGGRYYCSDLEYIYKISKEEAKIVLEKILSTSVNEEKILVGKKTVYVKEIKDAINARTDDFVKVIRKAIKESGFTGYLGKGVSLTGGAIEIDGMFEWIKGNLGYSTKKAYPIQLRGAEGKNSRMSVCIGILLDVMEKEYNNIGKMKSEEEINEDILKTEETNIEKKETNDGREESKGIKLKIKEWFSNFI